MTTTSQKHAQLKKLSKQIQDNIWKMLKITDEILSDKEYVDQFGGEDVLMDHLEQSEFSHFGGKPTLPEMLRAYKKNPTRKTWQDNKFNIHIMIDLARPQAEGTETIRINWKAKCKELELQVEQQKAVIADYKETVGELRESLEKSEEERLKNEGRIIELERRLGEIVSTSKSITAANV